MCGRWRWPEIRPATCWRAGGPAPESWPGSSPGPTDGPNSWPCPTRISWSAWPTSPGWSSPEPGGSPGVNVLLLILDGLSPRHVRAKVMPTLSAMAEAGGWNKPGGVAVMPASTYPNHATFVTGVAPAVHGLWSSVIPTPVPEGESDAARSAAPLVDA